VTSRPEPETAFGADPVIAHPGELVPAEFEGVAASVHSGLVNIELPGHYFVSLVTDHRDRTALSVFVESPRLGRIANARVGGRARGTPEGLQIPGLPFLRYATGRRFTGRLELPGTRVSVITSPATLRALGATLRENPAYHRGLVPLLARAGATGPEDPFVTRARSILGLEAGSAATNRGVSPTGLNGNDPPRPRETGPTRLIGLGPGFTPAGDDFLAGAILAEALWRVPAANPSPINRADIRAGLRRTTTGGATILMLALEGRPPLFVHTVCDILSRPDLSVDSRAADAAAVAARYGHSSGLDLLTGFLWRAGNCDGRPVREV
jgi:hypothetical protein